jgi:hypothetical protein
MAQRVWGSAEGSGPQARVREVENTRQKGLVAEMSLDLVINKIPRIEDHRAN